MNTPLPILALTAWDLAKIREDPIDEDEKLLRNAAREVRHYTR